MPQLMSAAEIAALNLPGLPRSKVGVRTLAEREGWSFEEKKGVGGTRRVYAVPEKYLTDSAQQVTDAQVAGGITSAGKADVELLEVAIAAYEKFADAKGAPISPDRKAAVISLLYNYLAKGASAQEVQAFLKVVG